MSITILEYFTKSGLPPANKPEIYDNATQLLSRVNTLLQKFGSTPLLTSGYRSIEHNISVGGSRKSAHCTGQAIDLSDKTGKLKEFCLNNLILLAELGLYMELPSATPTWCHLQTRPTKKNPFKP